MSNVIVTRYGAVEGVDSEVEGIRVFRGIPYGADTSGQNRWRPPRPPEPWTEVRRADTFGDACAQNQRVWRFPASENCLSLNVWTPLSSGAGPHPVLVWIHGGRFVWGASSEPEYDGAALSAQGVVVVTVNYRLGVFGFLAHPELSAESNHGASGNYGLMDQVAALRWVQDNIAAFGGDPGRVTIAGQSAGAACVMDHVYSPHTKGLFHGAIAESGALHPRDPGLGHLAASYRQLAHAEEQGAKYLAEHGVSTIAELRELPVEQLLVGNDASEPGHGRMGPPIFRPVLDGHIFPRSYHDSLMVAAENDVPVMTGTNKDEDGASPNPAITLADYLARARETYGSSAEAFLRLYPAIDDASAAAAANTAARDFSRTSTFLWARARAAQASAPVFRYFWTHAAPGPDEAERGAFHGSEIPYFLNSLDRVDRPWTVEDRRIAATVSTYVARFVATGDPNGPGSPHWQESRSDTALTMQIGDDFGPIPVAGDEARLQFFAAWLEGRTVAR